MAAARSQEPELAWLPDSLARCTRCVDESEKYSYFVDPPTYPNLPGSGWQFQTNIILTATEYGDVALDIIKEDRIGGIEYLDKSL